jgi:1-acyl-sn-glycerol-3-phosphate acyltransferase
MKLIISIITWIIVTACTIVLFFVMLLVLVLTFPFDQKRNFVNYQCFWWSHFLIRYNPFWKIELKGIENIDKQKTYVIISNHQSFTDIALLYQLRSQFKWVAKDSLFLVPFLGWSLSLGKHIPIRRGNIGSVRNVYRQASTWLGKDMSVLFFAEGSRSESCAIMNFHNGAFKLAINNKVAILPISIKGSGEYLPKGSWIFNTTAKTRLEVFPSIETKGYALRDYEVLKKKVRQVISVTT